MRIAFPRPVRLTANRREVVKGSTRLAVSARREQAKLSISQSFLERDPTAYFEIYCLSVSMHASRVGL